MKIGNVYADPRGKITRDGKREHVFNVRADDEVRTYRYGSRDEAEAARAALVREMTSALAS